MEDNLKKKNIVGVWDFFLIIGVLTSAMTELRIGKIGVSEVFLFLWMLKVIIQNMKSFSINIYIYFWIIFIFSMTLGLLYSKLTSVDSNFSVTSIITYIYFFLFVFALSQYSRNIELSKGKIILKKIYFWGFYIYSFLYVVAITSPSIFGFNLWYGPRLSILSTNPHQFIFIITPLLLLGIYLYKEGDISSLYEKYIVIIGTILFFWMGLETESSTFIGTVTIILIANILFGNYMIPRKVKPFFLRIATISLIIAFVSIISDLLYEFILTFIRSDENGLGRIDLWFLGIEKFLVSPIFGLGFGSYIQNQIPGVFMEAHNIYIDVATRGGLISLLSLIGVFVYVFVKSNSKIVIINFLLFFTLYGMAGFTLRRITMWFFLIFLIYISKKQINYNISTREERMQR